MQTKNAQLSSYKETILLLASILLAAYRLHGTRTPISLWRIVPLLFTDLCFRSIWSNESRSWICKVCAPAHIHFIRPGPVNESVWTNRTSQIPARVHPGGASGKEPACQCIRCGFHPWVRKIIWRKAWQPAPVFLPGESHEQRSLVSYSPWRCTVLNMTETTSHVLSTKLPLSSESYGEIYVLLFWTLEYKVLKPGTFAAISYRKSIVILRKNMIFRQNKKYL